jgi:hypothetical protein
LQHIHCSPPGVMLKVEVSAIQHYQRINHS